MSAGAEHQIDSDLAAFATEITTLINKTASHTREDPFLPLAPDKIYLAKLPVTGPDLFGREAELQQLDDAWADPHTNILSLVAWGGVGKSALVNGWLNSMARDNYRGAERAYGWSFYSQGTKEERQVSADDFFADALEWFGYDGPPILSPWDKGKELAGLVRARRTLFILDGLEPLQYPPGEMQGYLKDQGLQALLKDLARSNPGLCLISSRLKIEDLEPTVGASTQRIFLENLSPQAGALLLEKRGVQGTEKELTGAAQEFAGHALALNLLGSYLKVVHEGEIRQRDLIPHLTEELEKGGHARRVMQSYENWLSNTPELNILYLMGLFDRPATAGAIAALRAEEPIPDLTDALHNLSEAQWRYAIKHLRDLRLLAQHDSAAGTLDCHPLVREHFGERLQKNHPQAWREAHSRLYDYYKKLPEKDLPDTLEEMEPLFAAVAHGCLAGKYQHALDDVYWERIRRKKEAYTVHKLGAFGADLAALSNFFDPPWRQPAAGLTDTAKAVVLSWAGFRLRALGRLREAAEPMQAGMELLAGQNDWKNAASAAGNLSELHLTLGEVRQAVDDARQSVDFADRSEDGFQRESKRATLADALHQHGELAEAEALFREAEAMQQHRQPQYHYLYSLPGFLFCDLLLSQGQVQEVMERFEKFLEWRLPGDSLLAHCLEYLTAGRSHLQIAINSPNLAMGNNEGSHDAFAQAQNYLNQAVAGLRQASRQDYLPRSLFARAELYRVQHNYPAAWQDLEEAREIAGRGEMKLFLADFHLEACRLCLAQGNEAAAREHLNEAEEMVHAMEYRRRVPEIKTLQKQLRQTKTGSR